MKINTNKIRKNISGISFICLCVLIFIAPPLFGEYPLIIPRELDKKISDKHLSFYKDPLNSLDIYAVAGMYKNFKPFDRHSLIYSSTKTTIWVRLPILNNSSSAIRWFIEYENPLIDAISFYCPTGGSYREIATGDIYPFSSRDIPYRNFTFAFDSPPGKHIVFFKIRSFGLISLPIKAWHPSSFSKNSETELPFFWIYIGILFAITLNNIYIFFVLREKLFLSFILYIFSITFLTVTYNGFAFEFLWPDAPMIANKSFSILMLLTIASSMQFIRSFLGLHTHLPFIDRMILLMQWSMAPLVALVFFIDHTFIEQVSIFLFYFTIILLFICVVVMVIKRHKPAIILFISYVPIFISTILFILMFSGYIENGSISTWIMRCGIFLTISIQAVGINDEIINFRKKFAHTLLALRESEQKYRTLVENAHDGIMLIIDRKPLYANKNMILMTGYNEKDFYSSDLGDFFPETPLGKNLVLKYYTDRMNDMDVPAQYEAQLLNRSGEIIDIIISAALITIGGKRGSIAIITNISDLMKAERIILKQYERIQSQYVELRTLNEELLNMQNQLLNANNRIMNEKEQLAVTLASIGDAVITCDIRGAVVLLNPVAENLMGIKNEDTIGKLLDEVISLKDKKTNEIVTNPFDLLFNYFQHDNIQLSFMLSNTANNEFLVEINGAPIKKGTSEIDGFVLIIRDVTEKNKLEQELLKMSKLESIGVLAGGIAHDFNNLLTAIIGNISIAKTYAPGNERLQKILDRLENAGERAANLTRQLMTFSKGGDPIKKTTNIGDLLKETANFMLSGSNIKPIFTIPNDLWPVDIDINQMSQVINNLIINSMQAMPDGGIIKLAAENLEDPPASILLPPGKYLLISIEDEGKGIPDDILDKIFDPYFTTKKGGTGLGLTSCYSIINKHDGYIKVKSKVGSGTTFYIYLCASSEKIELAEEYLATEKYRHGKILVMDDEDYIREVSRHMLTSLGYDVETASDGNEAIIMYQKAQAMESPFDAVIMDLTVPGGMGGGEAIQALKVIDPNINAIVTSGYSDDPIMSDYHSFGFKGILIKPFKINDIAQIMDKIMS